MRRCEWANGELDIAYHDNEWGKVIKDDRKSLYNKDIKKIIIVYTFTYPIFSTYMEVPVRRPATDINTKQRRILEFIRDSLHNEYRCPTVREICAYVGLSSTSTVQSHLNTLEKFGYIKRDPNKNRAITILDEGKPKVSVSKENNETTSSDNFEFLGAGLKQVPLIGTVQAGTPITAVENLEATLTLPVQLTGDSDCFMLRVQGESMMNIGMYEGDMLIVRHQNTANNGDIVVARIDDEATVKRFYKENGHIRLQPENDNFDPIIVDDCHIEGLVIGLVRDRI